MYLFQPEATRAACFFNFIYIPLCIYFNYRPSAGDVIFYDIYIPLCIYFNLDLQKPYIY